MIRVPALNPSLVKSAVGLLMTASQIMFFSHPGDKTSINRVPPATCCDARLIRTRSEECHLLRGVSIATSAACSEEGEAEARGRHTDLQTVTGKSERGRGAGWDGRGCCGVTSLMTEHISWLEHTTASSCPQRSPVRRLTRLCFICLTRTDEIAAQGGWLQKAH